MASKTMALSRLLNTQPATLSRSRARLFYYFTIFIYRSTHKERLVYATKTSCPPTKRNSAFNDFYAEGSLVFTEPFPPAKNDRL